MELINTKDLYENDAFVNSYHSPQAILIEKDPRQSNGCHRVLFLFLFAPRYFHFQSAGGKERQAFSNGGKSTGVPVKARSVISFST